VFDQYYSVSYWTSWFDEMEMTRLEQVSASSCRGPVVHRSFVRPPPAVLLCHGYRLHRVRCYHCSSLSVAVRADKGCSREMHRLVWVCWQTRISLTTSNRRSGGILTLLLVFCLDVSLHHAANCVVCYFAWRRRLLKCFLPKCSCLSFSLLNSASKQYNIQ